jgi:TolA-binding protein
LGGNPQPAAPQSGDTSGAAPSGSPSSAIIGNLLNQVSQLQAQVQQLNGRVDTLQNQVDTQNAATQKEIGDLNFKVTGSASPTGAPASAPGAPPVPGAPQSLTAGTLGATAASSAPPLSPSPPPAGTSPKSAIAAAQVALSKHDYATAQADAQTVLATAKSTPEGYKAQYIVAEALYGQGKPQDAAIAFDDAYNRDRSGTYAPGSLLGLANSLTDIGQQSAACDTLSSLNSQFPTPPPGMGSRIKEAEARAHCG